MSTIENYYNFISDLERIIKRDGKAMVKTSLGFIICDEFVEYESTSTLILIFAGNMVAIFDVDYLQSNYGYYAL